jgi:hypothetical protein
MARHKFAVFLVEQMDVAIGHDTSMILLSEYLTHRDIRHWTSSLSLFAARKLPDFRTDFRLADLIASTGVWRQ